MLDPRYFATDQLVNIHHSALHELLEQKFGTKYRKLRKPMVFVSRKVSSFSVSFSAPCHPVASPPSVREERNAVRLGTGGGLEGQDAHQDEGLKI